MLPPDVYALSLSEAAPAFDARRDARARIYAYRILRGRDPLLRRHMWELERELDWERIREATSAFHGEWDATSFAASTRKGEDNRVRVERAEWIDEGDVARFEIVANRFVHHMVRNIVGTLVEVGRGAIEPAEIATIIAARDRSAAGPTAPARGLCLVEVLYDRNEGASPDPLEEVQV